MSVSHSMISDHVSDDMIAGGAPVRLPDLPADKYLTESPTEERREQWASARFNPLSQGLPPRTARDYWWRVGLLDLAIKLPRCAGWAVVAPDPETTPYIITEGFLLDGAGAVLELGGPSSCHDNAVEMVQLQPDRVIMMTGFALSDDGMWRAHSWCVRQEDDTPAGPFTIVETTCRRLAYFGHVVRRETCDMAYPRIFRPERSRERRQAWVAKATDVLREYYEGRQKEAVSST